MTCREFREDKIEQQVDTKLGEDFQSFDDGELDGLVLIAQTREDDCRNCVNPQYQADIFDNPSVARIAQSRRNTAGEGGYADIKHRAEQEDYRKGCGKYL